MTTRKQGVAPEEAVTEKFCHLGHPKVRTPGGHFTCPACNRRHYQRRRAPIRRKRLEERRRRIGQRRSPPPEDCIWAAGHFEGEGTVTIISGGHKCANRPRVSLASTDRNVIAFFQSRWPGHLCNHTPKTGRARTAVVWRLESQEKVEGFLLDMLPYLQTPRVRVKTELLIEDLRDRAHGLRTEAARQRAKARHERMRKLNRRGVRGPGEGKVTEE